MDGRNFENPFCDIFRKNEKAYKLEFSQSKLLKFKFYDGPHARSTFHGRHLLALEFETLNRSATRHDVL